MLISQFRCPSCGVLLKPGQPQPPGKEVKCYQCRALLKVPAQNADGPIQVVTVPPPPLPPVPAQVRLPRPPEPAAEQEFYPRPRRRRFRAKRASSRNRLPIGLSIAFAILLVGAVILGAIGAYGARRGWFGSSLAATFGPGINRVGFERLRCGMTLRQIENTLGPGTRIQFDDLPSQREGTEQNLAELARQCAVTEWYDWHDGGTHISVGFASSRSGRQVAVIRLRHTILPGATTSLRETVYELPDKFE